MGEARGPPRPPTSRPTDGQAAEEEQRLREVDFVEVLKDAPDLAADDEALRAWLARAAVHRCAQAEVAMAPFADRVLAFEAAHLPDADRRIRRRLVKLQSELRSPSEVSAMPAPVVVAPALLPIGRGDRDADVRAEVVAVGRAAAFVSNRRDEDLRGALVEVAPRRRTRPTPHATVRSA